VTTRALERSPGGSTVAPVSLAQRRLWFLAEATAGSAAYNVPLSARLAGRLEHGAMQRALAEIVHRHEALRTTFADVDGAPVQMIADRIELPLPLVDLTNLPRREREEEARRLGRQLARDPFHLSRPPLVRAQLVRLADEEHVLLLCAHHILLDSGSMDVFVHELGTLYAAFVADEPVRLPPLRAQYRDYVLAEQRWLESSELEEQLDWWRDHLAGVPTYLPLPVDRPRPKVPSWRGGRHRFVVSSAVQERLVGLARRERATLFMLLVAALGALLSRHTREEDVVVGAPVANRAQPEAEGLIGFFVNTLPLRVDLSGDPSFLELVARVRAVTLQAFERQAVPFERLVQELDRDRGAAHQPLAQVMLTLNNALPPFQLAPGLTAEIDDVDNGAAKFDLALDFQERAQGLAGEVTYSADLFEAATIERLAAHLARLLEGAAADPEARLSELPLLDETERRTVLEEWNSSSTELDGRTLPELVEAHAARSPDAPALVSQDGTTSYGELARRADLLARRLRAVGARPETLVGVCLERSPELVIGLLAVMKAGAVYLPLDPSYPSERLRFMLADSGVGLVLTTEALREQVSPSSADIVTVEETVDEGEATPAALPGGVRVVPANIAYAIYTSGSTGQPKAVAVTHGGLSNLVQAQASLFSLGSSDRVLAFASPSFDASIAEIGATLAAGATLVVITSQALTAELADVFTEFEVTVVTLPPSVLARIEPTTLEPLRLVISAGEALRGDVSPLAGERRKLFNAYGPTETAVCATAAEVDVSQEREPPIGRPIANTRAYLLDRHFEPVPIGVAGELFVGGVGVARGYLRRPGLTAALFVPDPFGPEPGARLYRTGDLARYYADGSIGWLDRIDNQVKVRGFRIEPGEIEAALTAHPSVAQAVVVARDAEDSAADTRLVGYVVPEAGEQVEESALRALLKRTLPDYMIPALVIPVASFPLTPAGKVDRAALPPLEPETGAQDDRGAQPRTPLERALVQIFSSALERDRIGIHDDFFELGGHSLLVVQVIAEIADAVGVRLPIPSFFETPTVAGVAMIVSDLLDE
jgi:amino acid adenylation domain-containing protein